MISLERTGIVHMDRRVLRVAFTLVFILAALTAAVWRLSDTSAEGPSLEISAPEQVEVGQPIELTLTVRNASGIGGYQARLLFNTAHAHLSGVDHSNNGIAALGRYTQTLGPNELDGGASFGLYSCPVDECGSLGKPVERGANGDVTLATISVTPDQAGLLTLELADLRVSDASGAEVAVQTDTTSVLVNVVVGQE